MHSAAEIQHAKIEFVAADWGRGQYLDILRSGVPGLNEIGPHYLPLSRLYSVTIHEYLSGGMTRVVTLPVLVNRNSGTIRMWKTGRVPAFSGRVEVR